MGQEEGLEYWKLSYTREKITARLAEFPGFFLLCYSLGLLWRWRTPQARLLHRSGKNATSSKHHSSRY
jgi:hypothetical protein